MHDIALIGAGRIGRIHARNIAPTGLRLRYVVDPVGTAAQALAAETGSCVADLDGVLGDPQVAGVVVASSTNAHLDHCLAAVAAGKAVFCEKPLDLDLARLRGAGDRLGGAGARLFLGFNRRFDPHFAALKRRLDEGAAGRLETLHLISHDPSPPPIDYVKVSGGLFKDMAIHDFDMARWLLGAEPVAVYAATACLVDPAIGAAGDVDTAKTMLRTSVGTLAVISNSRRSGYGYDQRIEAYCAEGLVRADNVLESTVSMWREPGAAADAFQNFFLERYAEAYRREMAHFAAILDGATPAIGYADGVAALALAEAAGRSAREGRSVNVQ